jgi:hypothetical protein
MKWQKEHYLNDYLGKRKELEELTGKIGNMAEELYDQGYDLEDEQSLPETFKQMSNREKEARKQLDEKYPEFGQKDQSGKHQFCTINARFNGERLEEDNELIIHMDFDVKGDCYPHLSNINSDLDTLNGLLETTQKEHPKETETINGLEKDIMRLEDLKDRITSGMIERINKTHKD